MSALAPVAHAAARSPRPAEAFCLPRGYVQQSAAWTHDELQGRDPGAAGGAEEEYWNEARVQASARYQLQVYRWAAALIRRRSLRSVLDVGCGPGTKLGMEIAGTGAAIEGVDQESGVLAARKRGSPGRYSVVDLESPSLAGGPRGPFDVVICADVLEHLVDPGPCVEWMRSRVGAEGLLLISTPDRDRLRGRGCMASPKREHVREWSRREFVRYLRTLGLEVVESRVMPGADEPVEAVRAADLLWSLRLAPTSPCFCHAVLCRKGC